MELMFYYCRSFSGQGIGAWDTSQAVLKLRAEEANGCLDTRRLAVEESNSGRW